jgi:tRNA threonylcarbamoyl adenosine modification protein YeaZ
MLILAVEQSSDTGSVAVLNDGKILGEREWDGLVLRSCGLFACLKELLAALALNLKDISHHVVDIGPGSYSGLRSSLAAVRAFAMAETQASPRREYPVYALTSAETLAFEIMQEFPADHVQVVGDARRQQLWTCLYKRNGNMPSVQSKIQLVSENDFHPAEGAVVVSPDWKRLHARLKSVSTIGARLVEENRVPKAGYLGKLAYQKIQLNISSEPLRPIYLHAAVKEKESEVRSQNEP